jgi:hypothetical protein
MSEKACASDERREFPQRQAEPGYVASTVMALMPASVSHWPDSVPAGEDRSQKACVGVGATQLAQVRIGQPYVDDRVGVRGIGFVSAGPTHWWVQWPLCVLKRAQDCGGVDAVGLQPAGEVASSQQDRHNQAAVYARMPKVSEQHVAQRHNNRRPRICRIRATFRIADAGRRGRRWSDWRRYELRIGLQYRRAYAWAPPQTCEMDEKRQTSRSKTTSPGCVARATTTQSRVTRTIVR